MIQHFYILTFITITYSLNAQFWLHSFESSGGYTASIAEFSDGSEDYWGRIDLTNKVMTDGTAIGSGASSVAVREFILPVFDSLIKQDSDIISAPGIDEFFLESIHFQGLKLKCRLMAIFG